MPEDEPRPYVKEWISDDRVLVYRFHETSKRTVDLWYDDITGEYHAWPDGKPVLLMLTLLSRSGSVSAYMLVRAREVSHVRVDLPGRTALVGTGLIAALLSNTISRALAKGERERKIFSDEQSAVDWLLSR